MKITDIHIYGYGKLENLQLNDLRSFSVFYGENEAGKSTIMAFIHGVLFGFPTKLQSEQRYEPKTHAKYGGKLSLAREDGTAIIVERVKGKASGDVKVFYEDGTIGGEEELKKELNGIDKAAFQGVYSFNIHGLQEISRLKEAEINRYLFSSGMTGTDAIFKLEDQWQKELDRLFKKSGKKPEINQSLKELRETELQLKKAKEKNETFTALLQRKEKSRERLAEFKENKEMIEEEIKQAEALEKSWQDLHEHQDIRERLKELETVTSFPVDGLQRLEKWQHQLAQQQSALEVTESRVSELEKEIEKTKPDKMIADRASLLSSLLERRELFARWQDQAEDHERTIVQYNAKIGQLMQELNIEEAESITDVQLDMVMKDRVKNTEESLYKLQLKKESLKDSIQAEENQLKYLEERCTELEDKLLEESKFQELQKKVRDSHESETLKIQYDLVQEQLRERKDRNSGKSKKGGFVIIGVLFSAVTALLIWFITGSLLQAGGTLAAILAVSLFLIYFRDNQGEDRYWKEMKNKAETLQEKMNAQESNDKGKNLALLKEQTELRESWKHWILKLENHQHTLHKFQEEERNLALQEGELQKEFYRLAGELRLPSDMHWKLLGEAFEKLKELVSVLKEKQQRAEIHRTCLEKTTNYKKELENALEGLPINHTTVEETLIRIKDILVTNERKSLTYDQLKKQQAELKTEHELIHAQLETIMREKKNLFAAARAGTEEEFRQKAAIVNEKSSLEQQERILYNRLGGKLIEAFKVSKEKHLDIKTEKANLEESLAGINENIYKENESLAETVYEISVLEEGESYTRLLYKFHEQKAALNDLSREWLKYSLARGALKRTIEDYKKEKLPRVIQTAESHLELLTNGEYKKIRTQQEDHFSVIRKDGMAFTPDELSQGTKEQVYIALRFALVSILKDVYSMPVIIDDGFVNFDEKRTEAVLKLLEMLKEETQVLLFTCHPHILNKVNGGGIIHLGEQQADSLTAAGGYQ
ncbi:AAA family ATPase [Bacillus salacetis]|uniref:ATP-binding protein n=1 Tax=Bacillus salacetis TaxID=2315464 RepID=UPI003BA17097